MTNRLWQFENDRLKVNELFCIEWQCVDNNWYFSWGEEMSCSRSRSGPVAPAFTRETLKAAQTRSLPATLPHCSLYGSQDPLKVIQYGFLLSPGFIFCFLRLHSSPSPKNGVAGPPSFTGYPEALFVQKKFESWAEETRPWWRTRYKHHRRLTIQLKLRFRRKYGCWRGKFQGNNSILTWLEVFYLQISLQGFRAEYDERAVLDRSTAAGWSTRRAAPWWGWSSTCWRPRSTR